MQDQCVLFERTPRWDHGCSGRTHNLTGLRRAWLPGCWTDILTDWISVAGSLGIGPGLLRKVHVHGTHTRILWPIQAMIASLLLTAYWQACVQISFLKNVQDELEHYQATWKYLGKMGNVNRTLTEPQNIMLGQYKCNVQSLENKSVLFR